MDCAHAKTTRILLASITKINITIQSHPACAASPSCMFNHLDMVMPEMQCLQKSLPMHVMQGGGWEVGWAKCAQILTVTNDDSVEF